MDASDRLIRSMQALLWERGYSGTSPKAVQQRARAGQGSMYHHFDGKAQLALAALQRSAEQLRTQASVELFGEGTAIERIGRYLRRERDVLRGCRIGRLTQDAEAVADPHLQQVLNETFEWLEQRLAEVIGKAQQRGEIASHLDALATAATVLAVLQGGYVLARAANAPEPFGRAIEGVLALLGAPPTEAATTHGPEPV